MKTPHSVELDPLQDRTIHAEEERAITMGYTFLGWANTWEQDQYPPEFERCLNLAHNYYSAFANAFKTTSHNHDGSDVTVTCSICKIYWKVDRS